MRLVAVLAMRSDVQRGTGTCWKAIGWSIAVLGFLTQLALGQGP